MNRRREDVERAVFCVEPACVERRGGANGGHYVFETVRKAGEDCAKYGMYLPGISDVEGCRTGFLQLIATDSDA